MLQPMTKKLKLHVEYKPDFRAIGLFTTQKDYRLCWYLNQHLHTDLRRLPDFHYQPYGQTTKSDFSVFHYALPKLMMHYFLIANKSREGLLFPEPKNLDYLLLLKQPSDQLNLGHLVTKIHNLPMIQAAFILDQRLGKRATAFFYDFEMYLGNAMK